MCFGNSNEPVETFRSSTTIYVLVEKYTKMNNALRCTDMSVIYHYGPLVQIPVWPLHYHGLYSLTIADSNTNLVQLSATSFLVFSNNRKYAYSIRTQHKMPARTAEATIKTKYKKNVFVVSAHKRFCLIPSIIFQLYRDGSSWVEPVLSYDLCVLLKDTHGPSLSSLALLVIHNVCRTFIIYKK